MRRDDWLLWQLPVGMTDDDFFVRFVTIFQRMADTVLDQVDNLEHVFDPTVAPDNMVRQMAEWFGVDWVDSSLDDRLQRQIVLAYADLIQWRGTKIGLRKLLELLTGGPVEVHDTGGVFPKEEAPGGPPHVRLDVGSAGWNKVEDLLRIVRAELPATVTFDLWIGADHVWPRSTTAMASAGHQAGTVTAGAVSAGGSAGASTSAVEASSEMRLPQDSTTRRPGGDAVTPPGTTHGPIGDVNDPAMRREGEPDDG
ncbi:MAG: phage tail protein [Ilumatobacter sp.]|uniref:phage tail protein n=1 Tax=Ilumatobacter sp. TaxID=1967498 RepID=UPI00391AC5F7